MTNKQIEKIIYSVERCISHVPDACRDCAYDAGHPYNECIETMLKDILIALREQRKIIRCKDCKHGEKCIEPYKDYWCNLYEAYKYSEWFCADGEREDDK